MSTGSGEARFTPGDVWLAEYRDWLLAEEPPVRHDLGPGFETVDLAPGSVLLVGAPPAVGKTALVTQWVSEALLRQPDLRAVICNVEMHPPRLFARMVARLGRVNMDKLQRCDLSGRGVRKCVLAGLAEVGKFADRLAFVTDDGPGRLPPFSVENVKATADAFGANLVCLDYLQRITVAGEGGRAARSDAAAMTQVMQEVRNMASRGVAVVVVSAVSRQKDSAGRSSYAGVNMASFRGSSELEFACDDAYVLVREDEPAGGGVTLQHVKARYREPQDIALVFDGAHMTFTPANGRQS